jgi:hypothetical protein
MIIIVHTPTTGEQVGYKSGLLMQNTHFTKLRALGLHIIIHRTQAPVHKQSHRPALIV